ncbi:MAG: RxLR-like protein [Harvfovirus sp.]|uniref:RxLR-like protein n=1 Tax=Harvfovirus sp. TaxID=2487768 RepID=A0A3G4ZZS8_9VIRU|nr:MAG: RxLR-like protein [Harvfovirus sp.]
MTTPYLSEIAKLKEVVPKALTEFKLGFFVDHSGSTGNILNGRTILDHELSLIREFGDYNSSTCVCWDDSAKPFSTVISSGGSTEPCCILQNKTTELIFNNSEVIFFMTDGEISAGSVTNFSKLLENKLDKVLIICVLFAQHSENPNISVFAPFFAASNVLIFQTDGATNKVLHTIGTDNSFKKGSFMKFADLTTYKIFNNYPKIPDGFNVLSEDSCGIRVFSMEKFLEFSGEVDEQKILSLGDWDAIVRMGKVSNVLDKIRLKINSLRNNSLAAMVASLKKNMLMPKTTKKNELIGLIMASKTENKELVAELQELLPLARVEEADVAKHINGMVSHVRSYWDSVRGIMAHYETATYTLHDMTGLANRAKRAKDVENDGEDVSMVLQHENVPQSYCCLHMDNGPAVIWLDKPTNWETTMGDHALTFPLDHFDSLRSCLKSNPVCGDCAQAYIMHCNGFSVYKETVVGYIPIDIKNNKRFVKKQLCKILCNSKLLSHVEMLLLSILDDAEHEWFDGDVRTHVVTELVENIMTNDTFMEEGKRVTLKTAVLNLDTDKILRQPLIAAFRLLGLLTKCDVSQKLRVLSMVKERWAYKLIEIMLQTFLHEGKDCMYEKIDNMLYQVVCGIPCLDSEVKLPSLREFVKDQTVIKMLERIGKDVSMSVDQLLPKEFIGQLLCSLKTIVEHERPLTVYQKLVRNPMFCSAYSTSVEKATDNISKFMIEKYHKSKRTFIPPYACYAGIHSSPTKLFFMDERLLGTSEVKFESVDVLARVLQGRLGERLTKAYGNSFPTGITAHTTLHKTVAGVLEEEKFLSESVVSDQMYIKCLQAVRKTDGKRGNIYNKGVLTGVLYCVNDFIRVRNEFLAQGRRKVFDLNACDFVQKLKNELEYFGMVDCVSYEGIGVPVCLSEVYKGLHADKILDRLNIMMGSLVKDVETKGVIDKKFEEVIVINVPEEEQKLENWKLEQEAIVKELNFVDTISDIKLIAGMDVSFDKHNEKHAVASIVVYQYPSLEIVARASVRCEINIKYIAGFLAFREVPVLMKLYQLLKESGVQPDLILMDGNGVWHPRSCGVASHFSVLSGVPCVGISKNVLVVDDVNEEKVFALIKDSAEGEMRKVITGDGRVLGVAYNVTGAYKNATFVSSGNGLSLETAMTIVRNVTIHRVTEPIRQADLLSRELLDSWK